jgi:serine/threonine-protein kinase
VNAGHLQAEAFRGFTLQETDRLILESPPPRPSQSVSVQKAVDEVVLCCMDKNPARRYPSATAVAEALRAAVMGEPSVPKVQDSARQAAAVHVDARPRAGADENDERLLDDLAAVLDMAEQSLRQAGFAILLQTGTTLLGARVLSEEPEAARREHEGAREDARALARKIATREGPHPALQVEVRLHVDSAVLRGPHSAPVIGGSVVDVSAWPADAIIEAGLYPA